MGYNEIIKTLQEMESRYADGFSTLDRTFLKKSDYKLKAGAVISFFGQSQAYTSANLTNEVAEKYLAMNPANANLFAELPDDWKARVAAYTGHNPVWKTGN